MRGTYNFGKKPAAPEEKPDPLKANRRGNATIKYANYRNNPPKYGKEALSAQPALDKNTSTQNLGQPEQLPDQQSGRSQPNTGAPGKGKAVAASGGNYDQEPDAQAEHSDVFQYLIEPSEKEKAQTGKVSYTQWDSPKTTSSRSYREVLKENQAKEARMRAGQSGLNKKTTGQN